MRTRRKNLFSALFWLLFAVYYGIESYHFDLGKWSMPGPGYFPIGAALLLGISSTIVLVMSLGKEASQEKSIDLSKERQKSHIVLAMSGMLAYGLLLNSVGFVLSTFLFVVFCLRVISGYRWFRSGIIALSITFASHLVFNVLLGAQLPAGVFRLLGR